MCAAYECKQVIPPYFRFPYLYMLGYLAVLILQPMGERNTLPSHVKRASSGDGTVQVYRLNAY